MVRNRAFRFVLVAASALVTACATGDGSLRDGSLASEFQLRVGESTRLTKDGLEIGFDAVVADSRCGEGAVCVWEGDAVASVWMQLADGVRQVRELHTGSRGPRATSFSGYTIHLVSLLPPAIVGERISPADYVAALQVTRAGVGHDDLQ